MMRRSRWMVLSAVLVAVACGEPQPPGTALESFTPDDLAADIAVIASDSFAGRAPSSVGEDRTMAFLEAEFQKLGLEPGNGTTWYQEVPLVRTTVQPGAELLVRAGGVQDAERPACPDAARGTGGRETGMRYRECPPPARFRYGDDFVAFSRRLDDSVALDASPLVFVGHGVVAPEYGWNDYAGLDVKGKTVVVLVNDPGFATGDTTMFRGPTMTYYGRWTYKFEEAARQGAAGVLIVHETAPAGYGWDVVQNSWTGPQFNLVSVDGNVGRAAVEGWIGLETARALFRLAGQEYDTLKARAQVRGFAAVPLDVTASVALRSEIVRSTSRNFLARLRGTDHADEYVIYMAHWDHFGTDPAREGDQIFNGAEDNATGVAGLLAMARAYKALAIPPSRSVLFLAVTAEEQGLLGSSYYAQQPVVPLEKTVAAINMDGMNVLGPMRDVIVVGLGMSQLDDYVQAAAAEQDRTVKPDQEPEKGYYYRSDHFPFAKAGVPALNSGSGQDHVEHGVEWTRAREEEYRLQRYHQPGDEMLDSWDLSGLVQDLRLLFTVGYRLANSDAFPNWREGTEFRAARDAMMLGESR